MTEAAHEEEFLGELRQLAHDHEELMACFDRKGRRITLLSWGTLLQFPTYRVLGYDKPCDDLIVSTLWLGLNQSYTVGARHTFETAVLDDKRILGMYRYGTEEEALRGHLRVYRMWGGQ